MKKIFARFLIPANLKLYISALIALVLFGVLGFMLSAKDIPTMLSVSLICLLFMLCTALSNAVINYAYYKKYELDVEKHFSADISAGLYNNMNVPFALCDAHGIIQLSNKAFGKMLSKAELKTKKISAISGFGIDKIMQSESDGIKTTVADRVYLVKGSIASPSAANLFLTVWYDITDAEQLSKTRKDNDALVAFVVIDNLEELHQIEQENFGNAAAEVDILLSEWANEIGGVIRRYESNKYILVYKALNLPLFIENKFAILEKIRSIRVGVNLLSITASIGTSDMGESFTEREKNAQAALEIALGRGGDQAVVKSESGISFFGGIVKGSQKRSTVKSRTVAQALMSFITKSHNVLIMGHKNPDFDSIGSCVGIARLCMYCGTRCNIVIDTENQHLLRCADMLSALPAYRNMFITAADAMNLNTSGTLLVICDVNNPTQFESLELAKNAEKTVFIDHHRITTEFESTPLLYYIEPSASSTCELVAEMLENTLPVGKLAVQEANLMYAGILLDTKRFSLNTGTRTFTSANYLRSVGANPMVSQELFKTSLDEMLREARFQKQIKIYRDKTVISINNETDNTFADSIAAAKFADKLLSIENIEASFVLLQLGSNVRISARSTGKINVQIILERLKGGGHYDAAATMLTDIPLEKALIMLRDSIDRYFDVDLQAKDGEEGEQNK